MKAAKTSLGITTRLSSISAIAGGTVLAIAWFGGDWLQSRNIPDNIQFSAKFAEQELVEIGLLKEDITQWVAPLIALGGIGLGLGAGFELSLLQGQFPKRKLSNSSTYSINYERLFADAYLGAQSNETRDLYLWSLIEKRPKSPLDMTRCDRIKAIKQIALLGCFPLSYQVAISVEWVESLEDQREFFPLDLSEMRTLCNDFLEDPSDLCLERIARKRGVSYDGSLVDRISMLCFLRREGLLSERQFEKQRSWAMQQKATAAI
jgi:hypothetical protein